MVTVVPSPSVQTLAGVADCFIRARRTIGARVVVAGVDAICIHNAQLNLMIMIIIMIVMAVIENLKK